MRGDMWKFVSCTWFNTTPEFGQSMPGIFTIIISHVLFPVALLA
jgi:hypothetical protein